MRVLFYGTPAFALPRFQALLARHRVMAVVTQPDRPAGRGQREQASPVKALAPGARDPGAPARPAPRPGLARAPRRARGRRRGRRGVRPDPAARRSSTCPRAGRSTCTPRFSRGIAARRRSRGPSSAASARPGSRPSRWTRGWTPAPSCSSGRPPIGARGDRRGARRAPGRARRRGARRDARPPGHGRPAPAGLPCGDPRAAAPQGGRRPRLDGARRDPRGARPGTQSVARGRHRGAGRPPGDLARAGHRGRGRAGGAHARRGAARDRDGRRVCSSLSRCSPRTDARWTGTRTSGARGSVRERRLARRPRAPDAARVAAAPVPAGARGPRAARRRDSARSVALEVLVRIGDHGRLCGSSAGSASRPGRARSAGSRPRHGARPRDAPLAAAAGLGSRAGVAAPARGPRALGPRAPQAHGLPARVPRPDPGVGGGPRSRGAREAAAVRGGDRLRERRAAGDRGHAPPVADPDGGGSRGGAGAPRVPPDVARRALVGPLRAGGHGGARDGHERGAAGGGPGQHAAAAAIDAVAAALEAGGSRRRAHAVRARGLRARARGGPPAARRPPGGERRRPGRGGHPGGACPGTRAPGRRLPTCARPRGPRRRTWPRSWPIRAGWSPPTRARPGWSSSGRRAPGSGPRSSSRGWPTRAPLAEDLGPTCDRVLVDAPCSNLGVLRRNPDGKWRRQPGDFASAGPHPDEHPRGRGRPGPARRGPRLRDLLARARGERGGRGDASGRAGPTSRPTRCRPPSPPRAGPRPTSSG